jgi:DNA excision repair protein ERCC-2
MRRLWASGLLKWCQAYFVLILSKKDLLDAKVASIVSQSLSRDAVIVFDECHNCSLLLIPFCRLIPFSRNLLSNRIHDCSWKCRTVVRMDGGDNVACESLSVDLTDRMMSVASRNIAALNASIVFRRRQQHRRLTEEYQRLISGLPLTTILQREQQRIAGEDDALQTPVLPDDILQEAVPQDIQKAEEFVGLLKKLIDHLKARMTSSNAVLDRPGPFLRSIKDVCGVADVKSFRMIYDRLLLLMRTLQVTDWHEFRPIQRVADFITLLATYEKEGFVVLFEPYDDFTGESAPMLRLVNVDAGLAFRWVMERFDTVVMTSGTLSPLEMYPRMLSFVAAVSASFHMSMDRNCVLPLILCRGVDQIALSSRYNDRQTSDTPRNYGHALIEFARVVPDGIVVFFVSYMFMQQVISYWTNECDILEQLRREKLVFVETPDALEASLAIQNYRTACDSGRGALLLSVARGRAAEGIDFDGHYGRAVILFGVPFQYTESRVLKAKLAWLAEHHQIKEDDFLIFDAMRQAAQCAGRVIRNMDDYGIVVFADRRYRKVQLRSKLPKWISQFLSETAMDLDVGGSSALAKRFLLTMAQPREGKR